MNWKYYYGNYYRNRQRKHWRGIGVGSRRRTSRFQRRKNHRRTRLRLLRLAGFFCFEYQAKQGDVVDIEIEKDENETLGLTLDESAQLEPMRCKNKCLFCFVDQLPKGMRETLYVKDDDYRLSFVSGNYVTFSNIGQKELE